MKRLFLLLPLLLLFTGTSRAQTGPSFFYVVTAQDSSGFESVFSNQASCVFTQGKHICTLNWLASTSTVAGYNIYRGTVSGGPYTKISPATPVSAVTYTDTFVLPTAPSGLTATQS